MIETGTDGDDSGFLDVATNTLAIIIIVTVFSLAVVRETIPTSPEPDAVLDPPLIYRVGERTPFPPPSIFVLFVDARTLRLDGDGIVMQLLDKPPGPVMRETVSQGRIDFMPLSASGYDVDIYQFAFTPDPTYIATLPPFDPAQAAAFVDDVEQTWRTSGHAPTFLVYPSGMDAFAAAHAALEQRAMPWRWVLIQEGQPIRLERSSRGFRSFTTYW